MTAMRYESGATQMQREGSKNFRLELTGKKKLV